MDYETLKTLVCILSGILVLLIGEAVFFIHRLEETNARKQYIIDLLLSSISKLKYELTNGKLACTMPYNRGSSESRHTRMIGRVASEEDEVKEEEGDSQLTNSNKKE